MLQQKKLSNNDYEKMTKHKDIFNVTFFQIDKKYFYMTSFYKKFKI